MEMEEPTSKIKQQLRQLSVKSSLGCALSDFKLISELGRGSYGVVYKVQSLRELKREQEGKQSQKSKYYVLKRISMKQMKIKHQQEAVKEVQLLKSLTHPHIIKYLSSFVQEDSLYILMEYAECGDLFSLLKEQRKKRKYFSEKDLWLYAYEIALALEYLHKQNIIHRDIKCLNIFISQGKMVKVGDLGVSKIVEKSGMDMQGTRVGTPLYLSPELIKQKPYSFKVDIWALGCVIYHLAALEPPFTGENLIALGNNIANKKPKSIPTCYSSRLQQLIDLMLEKKSTDRPTSSELLAKFPSFVKTAYETKLEEKQQASKSPLPRKKKVEQKKDENKEKILPLPLPPPVAPQVNPISPLVIPKTAERAKSPRTRESQSVDSPKRNIVGGGGSPKGQILKLNLPPTESVNLLNQAPKVLRTRPHTAKSRQIQRRGSQLEAKKIQSQPNQSPPASVGDAPQENLVIFSRQHMKDPSHEHRAHFQFVKRRPQSAKLHNKIRPRFLDRQESPVSSQVVNDVSPLHRPVTGQSRRESTGAVIQFVRSPPPITLNSVKHSKLAGQERKEFPSKINRICSQKLLPTYTRVEKQLRKEDSIQNQSMKESPLKEVSEVKSEKPEPVRLETQTSVSKVKQELTPLKKCDSSPFAGGNTKSMVDLNELINQCFVKNIAVVVKEECLKVAKLPIVRPSSNNPRQEDSAGKLRLRKESNGPGSYYARKIQDTSLNTTGRRDSLKRKAPGVSILKQMCREDEERKKSLISTKYQGGSTETTRLNTSGLKTGNSIDFRYKSESSVHFFNRADSKRITSHSHTCSRSSLISQTPQHTTSIAFYRHEGDRRGGASGGCATDAETSRRGAESPHVLNYINRNLYSNQHQIMMEACEKELTFSIYNAKGRRSSEDLSELEGPVCEQSSTLEESRLDQHSRAHEHQGNCLFSNYSDLEIERGDLASSKSSRVQGRTTGLSKHEEENERGEYAENEADSLRFIRFLNIFIFQKYVDCLEQLPSFQTAQTSSLFLPSLYFQTKKQTSFLQDLSPRSQRCSSPSHALHPHPLH